MNTLLKIFSTISAVILFCSTSFAQPGYVGKKFFAEYNFGYFLEFEPVESIIRTSDNEGIRHLIRHNIALNYVVGRKTSLFFSTDIYGANLNIVQGYDFPHVLGGEIFRQIDVLYKPKFKAFGVGASFHPRRARYAIAPLGIHFNLGMKYVTSRAKPVEFLEELDNSIPQNITPNDVGAAVYNSSHLIALVELENRHIWYDRILFSYGISFGLDLIRKNYSDNYINSWEESEPETVLIKNEQTYKRFVQKNVRNSNRLMIYMGLGFLLF